MKTFLSYMSRLGPNGYTGIGSGVDVVNLVRDGHATWSDIGAFTAVRAHDLSKLAYVEGYGDLYSINEIRENCDVEIYSTPRFDIRDMDWWVDKVAMPAHLAPVDLFTADMGDQPEKHSWLAFVERALDAGYQLADSLEYYGPESIANPYMVSLQHNDDGSKLIRVPYDQMNPNNGDYINAITDFYVRQLQNSPVDGVVINAGTKTQHFGRRDRKNVLSEWVWENANPGWNLATNTGGTVVPTWQSATSFGCFAHRTATIFDLVYGAFKIAQLLRMKLLRLGLTQKVVFWAEGLSGTWRHHTDGPWWSYRKSFWEGFKRDNPGATNVDADQFFADLILEAATIFDGFMMNPEPHQFDFSAEWLQSVLDAAGDRLFRSPDYPQQVKSIPIT